jgi:hypothetical protein
MKDRNVVAGKPEGLDAGEIDRLCESHKDWSNQDTVQPVSYE